MRKPTLTALCCLLSRTFAQSPTPPIPSTTVSLYVFAYLQAPLTGSVITAGPTATSYLLNRCATDSPTLEDNEAPNCESVLPHGVTILEGPSTLQMTATLPVYGHESTIQVSCAILQGDSATCVRNIVGDYGGPTTDTWVSLTKWAIPVTITAGLEKLPAATAGTTAGGASASGSASREAGTAASTGSITSELLPTPTLTPTESGTSGTASGSSTSPSPSTAGVAATAGNAAVAGVVAVALGGVLLM